MATLTVTTTTDYRPAPAESNITDIVFATLGGSTTATFDAGQFGPGLISNTVTIGADGGRNVVTVYLAAPTAFSAAGWAFTGWSAQDQMLLIGASGDDTITGSTEADFISMVGAGDSDVISGGGGDDQIDVAAADVGPGTSIDGGDGAADVIMLYLPNTTNLRQASITGVEKLLFGGNNQTAILNGAAFGPGGIAEVNALSPSYLIVRDDAVDLSGVNFAIWSASSTITLDGNSTIANALTGSSRAESMTGRNASSDTMTGGGGADTLTGGNGNDTYVDPTGDSIVEAAGQGTDTVTSDVTFSLSPVANVERLFLQGAGNTDATGNTLANHITGTSGANLLRGVAGADSLNGGAGDDTLEGGTGNDTMIGGSGDNIFHLESVNSGDDRADLFSFTADRFDLDGRAFTNVSEAGGNTLLTHSAGTVLVAGVTGRSLEEWNTRLTDDIPGLIVTTLADVVDANDSVISLREALALANAGDALGDGIADVITFATGLAGGTIRLTGVLNVTEGVTINGDVNDDGIADITISGDANGNDTRANGLTVALDGGGGYMSDNVQLFAASSSLTLESLVLTGGRAANGGAVRMTGGDTSLTVTGSIIGGNVATGSGGGIEASPAEIFILNTSLSGNHATLNGGGLAGAFMTLTNATLSGNSAGGTGGGFYSGSGTALLLNSTLTGNDAASVGGGYARAMTLGNSIVLGNQSPGAFQELRVQSGGTEGNQPFYEGLNIVGIGDDNDGSDGVINAQTLGFIFAAIDPTTGGGLLAYNGGPAWTVALAERLDNVALDSGFDRIAPVTDARGEARFDQSFIFYSESGFSDLGAYELQTDVPGGSNFGAVMHPISDYYGA